MADALADEIAIKEARRLGIPVIALVDTNVNPDIIDYIIAGNDDAIQGIQLIVDYIKQAVAAGLAQRKTEVTKAG